jgi:hypothetical protein
MASILSRPFAAALKLQSRRPGEQQAHQLALPVGGGLLINAFEVIANRLSGDSEIIRSLSKVPASHEKQAHPSFGGG